MSYESLLYEQDDHVVTLTYSLPGACGYTRNVDISMFMRRDKHTLAAAASKAGNPKPDWPHHGL